MANRPWKSDESVFASFSGPNQMYREWLKVEWSDEAPRVLAVIALNPSTADETSGDPTVRKVANWAKANGYTALLMLNAYPFRATDPRDMLAAECPFGTQDVTALCKLAFVCDRVVAAWGNTGAHLGRGESIKREFDNNCRTLYCWGTNKGGSPIHPLYPKLGELKVWK